MAYSKDQLKKFSKEWRPVATSYKKKTDSIFITFHKEIEKKKIVSISESNKIWSKKYAPKLEKLETALDSKYRVIWNKHFGS